MISSRCLEIPSTASSAASRGRNSSGIRSATRGSTARARSRRPTSWRWTRERALSTSRPATARRTTSSADHWDCRSSTRWTTTAASSLEWSTLRGSPSGRPTRGSSTTSGRSGCWLPSGDSTTRIRTAGAARTRRSSVPPSSGSSSSTSKASARASSRRSSATCSGSRRGARSASTTWWRTGPSGSSRASGSGGCRSSRSTARGVERCSSRSGSSTTSRGSSARARVPMSGTRVRPALSSPPGRAAPSAAATGSRRRPISSTSGSTRGAATPPSSRRGPSSGGRRRCTSRARTSTAAGSSPRSSNRSEGSDQHRGWFQSSLLESVGTRGAPPYKAVITHGFFVDGEGRKMSKSLGNYIALEELVPKYGAEILRLWVTSEDYTQDIRVSLEILDRLADAYRRIRNTFRFLLGNLSDFDPARDRQSSARLDEIDRWILDRLGRLVGRVTRAYETYEFHTVFHAVHNFCAVDLSAQYLDIIKDRPYTSAADDPRRRAAQTACYEIFSALARLMAPILTFTAEEAWSHLPGRPGESVHLELFPEAPREWLDDTLAREWGRPLEGRREVAKALETARAQSLIGSGLEARVRIAAAPEDLPELLRAKRALLPTLFIVSQVELGGARASAAVRYESQEIPGLVIGVDRARGPEWH